MDSTEGKIHDVGDWLEETHTTKRKRRFWRKLHLGLDLFSGDNVASEIPPRYQVCWIKIDGHVDLFPADGASEGDLTCDLLLARYGERIEIAIPAPKTRC